MDEPVFEAIAEGSSKIPQFRKARDGFSRMDVVNAFADAFQLIGGTTRLALWANQNPDKFYGLYAKLLPSTQNVITDTSGPLEIVHSIAPTALDVHQTYEVPYQEVGETYLNAPD